MEDKIVLIGILVIFFGGLYIFRKYSRNESNKVGGGGGGYEEGDKPNKPEEQQTT